MFSYYLNCSAPKLSGCIPPDFWTKVVPKFAATEAPIRHSVLALASLHEFVNAHPGSKRATSPVNWRFAMQEYSKAVAGIRS